MATFTFPFAFQGTASVEANIADEARLTIEKDLLEAIEVALSEPAVMTDNGVAISFEGFEFVGLASEAPTPEPKDFIDHEEQEAWNRSMRRAGEGKNMEAMLRKCADWFAGGSPDNEPQADDIRAILARIDAAEAEDDEQHDDEPCPINRRPKGTCPASCDHGEA